MKGKKQLLGVLLGCASLSILYCCILLSDISTFLSKYLHLPCEKIPEYAEGILDKIGMTFTETFAG